jgi:hypothetical protein
MVDTSTTRTTRERELESDARARTSGFTDLPGNDDGTGRTTQARTPHHRTTVGLVTSLARDAGQLLRQELELARAEIGEKVDQVRTASAEVAGGAAIAHAGLLFLLLSAFLGLDVVVQEPWLSALIVGGVVTLIGLAMLAAARRNLKTTNLKLEKTARSLEEDAELARDEARRKTT